MRTILLVEDDPLQAFVRMSVLQKRFSNVRRVVDATEALCLIEQPQFSDNLGLIISGHQVPGMGGPAFVAELRTRIPSVPVLVLGTGSETASDYAAERVQFLARPIASEELLSLAGRMMTKNGVKTA
jgi:CheY-like chemotaxis protein